MTISERLQSIGTLPVPDPGEVAEKIYDRLLILGWCLCSSRELGEKIVIILAEGETGYPAGYPVYTLHEINTLAEMDLPAIHMVHNAKKIAGAELISQEIAGNIIPEKVEG